MGTWGGVVVRVDGERRTWRGVRQPRRRAGGGRKRLREAAAPRREKWSAQTLSTELMRAGKDVANSRGRAADGTQGAQRAQVPKSRRARAVRTGRMKVRKGGGKRARGEVRWRVRLRVGEMIRTGMDLTLRGNRGWGWMAKNCRGAKVTGVGTGISPVVNGRGVRNEVGWRMRIGMGLGRERDGMGVILKREESVGQRGGPMGESRKERQGDVTREIRRDADRWSGGWWQR